MIQYIPGDIFRASYSVWGDKIWEKMEGGKRMKRLSVHFNVHTPIQIVFLSNFKNCKSPSKMKPCTRRDPKIDITHKRVVMSTLLTIE
jgi:hypothetical protein